ncbi:MAG: DUF723 domain-containing protein [Spirochaetaceae bacterium]|jgi:hypothetical protein|nr:DUF723 domain-containing protein [Spirochaetaceae bacterium]
MRPKLLEGATKISTMYLFRHGSRGRSQEEFITLAKMIYGGRFSYEKVIYRHSRTPVEIVCKKHGPFFVTPDVFLKGSCCPQCRREYFAPITNREYFIEKAEKIFGKGTYDYSEVRYRSLDDPITVICPVHGPFTTTVRKHINGRSPCPECNVQRPWDTRHFLKAAKAVHGDTYDYAKIGTVTGARQKLTIICPVHGEFTQSVQNHIHQGSGCPQCANMSRAEKTRVSFGEFVERARKTHGKKYRYIASSYTNLSSPVTIVCPLHGEFSQNAEKHVMNGHGCHKCGLESRKEKRRLSFAEFVKKARKIHGQKYRYDEASYTDAKHPTVITCDIHGQFLQKPSDHLHGHGCRVCGYQKVSRLLKERKRSNKKGK